MRYLLFISLCAALTRAQPPAQALAAALPAEPAQPQAQTVLPEGTPVRMRINRTISSADAHVGDNVDFETLDDIKLGDFIVIPKSSTAIATVTEAQPKRRMGRGGKLAMNIDYVRLPSNEKLALRGVQDVKGGGHTGAMTGGMVATAIVFFPAAPFFLFMKGKDITIPKGHEVTVYTSSDYTLARGRTQPVAAPPATPPPSAAPPPPDATPPPAAAPAAMEASPITVKSTPAGAEITVDGSYVGNTPSIIQLPTGEHEIEIAKSGFKAWRRKITVRAGGQVTVDATLERQ